MARIDAGGLHGLTRSCAKLWGSGFVMWGSCTNVLGVFRKMRAECSGFSGNPDWKNTNAEETDGESRAYG